MSRAFDAYLYLADPDGEILAQDDDGGGNLNSRIVYRADRRGTYYLIATSLGGNGLGAFSFSVRVLYDLGGTVPQGLPSWFRALDTDGDGQVSLREWRQGGKGLGEFRRHDLNDDGFITPDEALRNGRDVTPLELQEGRASYEGALGKPTEERYLDKKAFKIFAVRLERGKTYQIEQVSAAFFAFLYLEDPDGEILARHNSGGNGRAARVVHRAARTGLYRVIATSQGGFRPGAFVLSVRLLHDPGAGVPGGLPPWFHDLDTDHDGQVSVCEWRQGGKQLSDFREYDLNDDGFITAGEVRRHAHHHAKHGGALPKGIPPWFKQLDADGDGQVSLSEWRQGGKQLSDFREYDFNDDGFITADEMRRYVRSHANRPKKGTGPKQ
jgi:Ca2+-binding EF-hand superfamily protein